MCEEKTTIIINEKYLDDLKLIEDYTGKTISEVLNNYTVPELMKLRNSLIFIQFSL